MKRLLDFARERLGDELSFAELGARLNASSQSVTNWKNRGVSESAALEAERRLGCSAAWILDGGPLRVVVDGEKAIWTESAAEPKVAGAIARALTDLSQEQLDVLAKAISSLRSSTMRPTHSPGSSANVRRIAADGTITDLDHSDKPAKQTRRTR